MTGMRNRPLSLRLLAVALMLSPLGILIELYLLYEIKPAYWYCVFNPLIWTPQVVIVTIITPLVGLIVWRAHRWSYFVLVGFSGLILINNIIVWASGHARSGIFTRILFSLGLVALTALEMRKEFAAPYFNPRLRWWEQAHRYMTDRFHVWVREPGGGEILFQADSFDISENGLYVVSERSVTIGETFSLDIRLPNGRLLSTEAKTVWVYTGGGVNPPGFGCHFLAPNKIFRREMRAALRQLRAAVRR